MLDLVFDACGLWLMACSVSTVVFGRFEITYNVADRTGLPIQECSMGNSEMLLIFDGDGGLFFTCLRLQMV